MAVFLRGMGQILWDVMVNTTYVHPVNFLAPGSRYMFNANNKAIDYMYCALCQSELYRVLTEDLVCMLWLELKNAHAGNGEVQARLYATYRREYEDFTHLPNESIDALFQGFTVVVNNMRANIDVLPYDEHGRAVKLLYTMYHIVWNGKVEAILESEKCSTLTVNEQLSKLKSAEVDRGLTVRLEGLTDPHSLALVGGSGAKTNANPSSRMYSLSSLMSLPDDEFDVLGEDELALLTWRFERMHENQVKSRRNLRTCFKCGKTEHFFAECSKVNNHDKHESKDKGNRSKKKEYEHGRKTWTREKIKGSSDIDYDSKDVSSSTSEEEEDHKRIHKKKDFGKYLNGLCCIASNTSRSCNKKDGLCGMACSSNSKRSQKNASDSDSDSEDKVCDGLCSLRKENEELVDFLDNRDHMLR
jgi:hypothetical protein